jgi:chemotaxis protein CheX
VGTVGFIGELKGLLTLYIDNQFSDMLTAQMLGMTPEEVAEAGHEVTNDTIGELTNMAAGAFKNQLADKGFPCKLTIPSLMRGQDLMIEPAPASSRRVFKYAVDDRFVYTDLSIKHAEGSITPFENH